MSVSNEIFTSTPVCGVDKVMSIRYVEFDAETIPQRALVTSGRLNTATNKAKDFIILAKPEITLMVMIFY